MARRKSDSPQKAALREMMSNYMKENDVHVKNGTDVNALMRDMMSVILEGTLDAEMDEELGYSKYDYKNKDTDNSRNGYSKKTMHTSYGDVDIDVPRDHKGEFEPQVVKKYQNTVTQDMEEKIISMYAKKLIADLKKVYAAVDEQTARSNLEEFGEKWDSKYPKISKSWAEHWPNLATYFKYPEAVRRLIYTTNPIEGFNRQLRIVTKSKAVLPSDESLLKMLYLAMIDITKKWTGHRQDWGQIHSQLEIYFEERLEGHRY